MSAATLAQRLIAHAQQAHREGHDDLASDLWRAAALAHEWDAVSIAMQAATEEDPARRRDLLGQAAAADVDRAAAAALVERAAETN